MLFASLSKLSKANCYQLARRLIHQLEMSESKGVPLEAVVKELEGFAPLDKAEPWDNVGLLVEPASRPLLISTVLLTNDLTESVLEEALAAKTDLIISYHPPIFAPLKRITRATWKERIIGTCLENKIAVYSPHTSWDACENGVTDWLSNAFKEHIERMEPIVPTVTKGVSLFDVICKSDEVNKNKINYFMDMQDRRDRCIQTYQKDEWIVNRIFLANDEVDLVSQIPGVMIYKTEAAPERHPKIGMGRKLSLKEGMPLKDCVSLVKLQTGLKHVRLALAVDKTQESPVRTIALVPGSGGSLLKGVKADLYITGEMFHHDLLEANHNSTSVILTNHSDSERGFLHHFKEAILKWFPSLSVIVSSEDRDPITTV